MAARSLSLETEDLVQNLRQMVISFEPHIREAESVDQVEETLQHLEENDENFHKYEIVKQLKKKIDEVLGPQIDEEIEKNATGIHMEAGQENLVTKITETITKSKPCTDLKKKLKQNMTDAIDELMHNFDAEFGVGKHKGTLLPNKREGRGGGQGSDEEDSSCGSSFNHGSLMFMTSEYLHQISEKIGKTKDQTMRKEALQNLNTVRVDDVISCEYFQIIKKHVLDALMDADEQVVNLGLKFVTRAFTTTSHHTKDIYALLAEHLISQFHNRKSSIPKIKNGLDISRPEVVKILKAFRLLNEFQHETTNYWIRYPEVYLEEILVSTLNLLSIHHVGPMGTSQQLSPIHFVALLDTKAQWFIKWMHGHFSRNFLLDLLEKYRPFVENSVKHCLEFSAARKVPFDLMSDISENISKSSFEIRRVYFTGAELEYAYFIHSACVIGKILCFSNGRKFFPIKLKDSEDPVSIKKLMVAMVLIVVDPSPVFHLPKANASDMFDPAKLITDVLKGLCSSEQACEICLYKDEITSTLLSPISHFLDVAVVKEHHFTKLEHQAPGEKTLLHVADILSMIASSTKGRRHLMYGEKKDIFSRTKSSAAHIIAEFTKKALLRQLPREAGPAPSPAVIGAYLYICRQLYNTCEGLLVLYPYALHTVVAEAWRDASKELETNNTPTPDDDSSSDNSSVTIREYYDVAQWKDTLRDNLLNFASTAKGILLLQQTGALNECMFYMHSRYEKKLQVSKCEKFGYGYMVTQVAATAPGMAALKKTGYIKSLVSEMWSVVECGPSDVTLFTPKAWPVDPIDRALHKHLLRLLNVLSAFPAVYEILYDHPLPTKQSYSFREIPETFAGLLDRIVLLNTPAKIHSLFNVEQSHIFGLRVLSVMISCLDSLLLMQSQYKIQENLLAAQTDNHINKDQKVIIIDMLTVERNNILVRSFLVGGPTERNLPSRTIEDGGNPYPYPLFSAYPTPQEYSPNLGGRSAIKQGFIYPTHQSPSIGDKTDNELTEFLDAKKPEKGREWLEKCRTLLVKVLLTKGDQVKGTVIQKLLELGVKVLSSMPEESVFPLMQYAGTDSALRNVNISPLQHLGIKMAVRYGTHLKVLSKSTDEATDRLTHLIQQVTYFLRQQQKFPETDLKYLQNGYPGFDWFAATIFLAFHGNDAKAWEFLQNFSALGASGYAWAPRLHASVHIPIALSSSGIPPIFSSTGHNIEFILQIELPQVSHAFKMSGYTPAQISLHWLTQCFWNYLDWLDICHYIVICLILGIDYQVYMCVSILKHLQPEINTHMQTQNLLMFLREEPLSGFKVSQNLKYMQELEKKYRKMILPDMLNITKP